METSSDDDGAFRRFSVKNLLEFNDETDELEKAHLQRKLNVEMYHAACTRNVPKAIVASMLHDDLVRYNVSSATAFATKFDKLLADSAINVDATNWKCTLDDSTTAAIMPRNQCKGKYLDCANDEITEREIAMLFDPTECEPNGKRMPNNTLCASSIQQNEKDDDGDEEVITFNLNFNRRKDFEIKPSNLQFNGASTSATHNTNNAEHDYKSSNSWQNRPNFVNHKRKGDDQYSNGSWKQSAWSRNKADDDRVKPPPTFKTGLDELENQYEKKFGNGTHPSNGGGRKTLGGRRTVASPFVLPMAQQQQSQPKHKGDSADVDMLDDNNDRLKHIDPKMIELIRSEIMDRFAPIAWDDIAGLEYAKTTIQEAVVWPILRPDIFTGLRRPPRGILLFGPPGTGKTLIGKCIASQSKSTFFSISASSLTSKWVGEAEKMVRTLFAVAAVHQPAVIFIDEIDSLLCQRSENEHESSRRVKTEFLVRLDGAGTGDSERILIVGATNRPHELDEAARRRFTKRLYIPLPEQTARDELLRNLLKNERTEIDEIQIREIGRMTNGFSGADLKVLCQEASMGPIRSIPFHQMDMVNVNDVRPLNYSDFQVALERVRASVSPNDLQHYIEWDKTYGSGAGK